MSKNKQILTILFIILTVIYLYNIFKSSHLDSTIRQISAPEIVVFQTKTIPLIETIEALGTTYANESVDITSSVPEIISELRFDDGQQVKKGEIIALLHQDEEIAQRQSAETQLTEDERELKRLESLIKQNAAAQNQYDQRKTLMLITKRRIQETTARIEDRTIRAPFDGVLGLRRVSLGALVEPGDVIATLDDLSKIKLDFTIPASLVPTLQEGMDIEVRMLDANATTYKGTISKIDTRLDPVTRSIVVRAILPNSEKKLRPGLLMVVNLMKDKRPAIVLPEESIIQLGSQHYIYVFDSVKQIVTKRNVKVGIRKEGYVEISEGLNDGEQVVTRGITKISPDQKVKLQATIEAPSQIGAQ